MTMPNKSKLDDPRVPRIKIDGVEWPIPRLAIEQTEVVLPLYMMRVGIPRLSEDSAAEWMMRITPEHIHDMATIVFLGLKRGHEELTREEFDKMGLGWAELLEAVNVVAQQTGILKAPQAQVKINGVSMGEVAAANSPISGP